MYRNSFILDEFHDKFLGQAKCLSGLNGRNDWKYRIGSGLFGTLDKTVTQILDGEGMMTIYILKTVFVVVIII